MREAAKEHPGKNAPREAVQLECTSQHKEGEASCLRSSNEFGKAYSLKSLLKVQRYSHGVGTSGASELTMQGEMNRRLRTRAMLSVRCSQSLACCSMSLLQSRRSAMVRATGRDPAQGREVSGCFLWEVTPRWNLPIVNPWRLAAGVRADDPGTLLEPNGWARVCRWETFPFSKLYPAAVPCKN
eukprot:700967-Amphidinium_carterae.1